MTKSNQQIKTDARIAFESGNQAIAFQTLWTLNNVNEFISYSESSYTKKDKESKKVIQKKENWLLSDYFWTDFILQQEHFSAFLSSESAIQLLHNYFKYYKKCVPEFEQKLATEFPKLFIKAIRVKQVFLESDRIEFLKSLPFGNDFNIHQKIWHNVFEIESQQWTEIQKELKNVLSLSLEDILSYCVIWLETNRFNDSSKRKITHLASVYSFFCELVLSNKSCREMQVKNSDDFIKHFFEIFGASFKDKSKVKNGSVAKLLFRISNWIDFKEFVIAPYSFDLNIEPIQQNELIIFNSTPEAFYRWLLNGVRYEVNQLNYYFQGNLFSEHLEKEGLIKIPGKTKNDIEVNRNLSGLKWATLLMLNDMGFESFKIGNNKIECEKLLSPLITYSFNRLKRYENTLKSHFESSNDWSEAFMKLTIESIRTDIRREPFFLMTESEYKKLNQEALSQLPVDSSNEVIQLFSFISNEKYEFNRFKYSYDVWQKPFMKIDDFLFCPMIFFASNIWFYSFTQAALFQRTERSETRKMETHLGDLLKEKDWKIKVTSDEEANLMKGDIDIFIEDESTLLFIQLKRTYFRLDLKDAYYDSCNTDSKAAKQLNEAEKYLSQPNPIYNSERKPNKWIVSTSFENIGKNINNCIKVNYFELLNALKNPETKTVNDLIKEIQADKNLKAFTSTIFQTDLPIEVRQLIAEVVKPLKIFESNRYRQIIFTDDEKRTSEYNAIFDKAVKLDSERKKNEALIEFKKCISLNPNDAHAIGAIANILSDMRDYKSAFIAFKEALKILPNDPYITRNFCLALMESGNWFDGLFKAAELFEKYPMLGDIKILFEKHFEQCVRHGLLNPQQLLELKTKWDNMN